MSLEKIHLRKLLQLFYANPRLQRRLLLEDVRNDRRKAAGTRDSGGDFYSPFWADVKDHIAGRSDLSAQVAIRIAANKTKARLYPILGASFLDMWSAKMRWRNEPFEFVPKHVKARLQIEEVGVTVKIENTLSVKVWGGSHRVIYPYFSEAPPLPVEGAILGFWVLRNALPGYSADDLRIVDIQRRAYFRPQDIGLTDDEEKLFIDKYSALMEAWRKLRDER